MARNTKATNAYGGEICFAVGGRQLVAGSLMVFTVAVLTSIGVHVVGQVVQPPGAAALETDPSERILLVEPEVTGEPRAAEESNVISVEPISDAKPQRESVAGADFESFYRETREGELYLQVVATRRNMAGVFALYLNDEGIPTVFSEASKEGLFRVLAGPIETNAQLNTFHAQLEELGFRPFVRRVRKGGE